jgi:hypothetical protein
MRAALSFAAAGFRAALRSGGGAIAGGEQAWGQTGGAQACQQARHEQMPHDDRKSAHNYPFKYTPGWAAGLAELWEKEKNGAIRRGILATSQSAWRRG